MNVSDNELEPLVEQITVFKGTMVKATISYSTTAKEGQQLSTLSTNYMKAAVDVVGEIGKQQNQGSRYQLRYDRFRQLRPKSNCRLMWSSHKLLPQTIHKTATGQSMGKHILPEPVQRSRPRQKRHPIRISNN